MKVIIGILRFIYDFVVGDCWQIAVGVVVVLGLGAWTAASASISTELLPILVGAGIVVVVLFSLFATTGRESPGK